MIPATAPVVLGPETIERVGQALDTLLPWLAESRFRILESGNLEFDHPEPAEAVKALRQTVEAFVPAAARDTLGRSSGLGWNIFFGHVVTWWLPQRRRMGFLRALVDRAALHQVTLQIRWNDGRRVPVRLERPGQDSLLWGGIIGLAAGLGLQRLLRTDGLLVLLVVAGGVVLGRIWQRVGRQRRCGDPLCHAQLGRAATCPTCGGRAEDR